MLTIALDGVVGEVRLPDSVRVVAGMNPPERAAGGHSLSAPLANRFCHIMFEPSVDAWLPGFVAGLGARRSRAVASDGVRVAAEKAVVAAFIQRRPELLHRYPQSDL
ncbi:AAA family ATPase, partial [Mycobacterium tuberculosis]|nr:AAA family ATPase [Mycobacterium tuberculosis]